MGTRNARRILRAGLLPTVQLAGALLLLAMFAECAAPPPRVPRNCTNAYDVWMCEAADRE